MSYQDDEEYGYCEWDLVANSKYERWTVLLKLIDGNTKECMMFPIANKETCASVNIM